MAGIKDIDFSGGGGVLELTKPGFASNPLDRIDANIVDDPNLQTTGSGFIEFLGPDEPLNPTPGRPTITIIDRESLFKQSGGDIETAIKAEKLHFLPEVDENFAGMRRAFEQTLTSEQLAVDKRVYDENVKAGRENRSFEKWFEVSRLDAYIRGYIFPDKADEWRKQGVYTDDQKKLLDEAKSYVTGKSPAIHSISFDPSDASGSSQSTPLPPAGDIRESSASGQQGLPLRQKRQAQTGQKPFCGCSQ